MRSGQPNCSLFYVTTGTWKDDPILSATRDQVIADLTGPKGASTYLKAEIERVVQRGIQELVRHIGDRNAGQQEHDVARLQGAELTRDVRRDRTPDARCVADDPESFRHDEH